MQGPPKKVNLKPYEKAYACRKDSAQAKAVDALWKGATFAELQKACKRKDGAAWTVSGLRTMIYWHVHRKGYGIRTEENNGDPKFFLVLPEGLEHPIPHK